MTLLLTPLFAAGWFELVVPIVVFVIWLINQLAAAAKKNPPPARPQGRPQAPGAAGGAGADNEGRRGLMDEVERFLRDARRAMEEQQQPANKPRPQPPQQRPQRSPSKSKSQRSGAPPLSTPSRSPLADRSRMPSRPGEQSAADVRVGGSVAEHVKQHFDTSRFDERAGRLSQLKQAVEQDIGAHVHSAFDHQVGTLRPQASTADTAMDPTSPAAQIAAMLRDPAGMRNAIILQEILSPPTHRW